MTTYYNINPKFYVSVDCIIFGFDEGELKLLLLKRNFEPAMGKWSLKVENEKKAAIAEAEKVVAAAKGKADANRILQQSITPELIQLKAVEKWDGKLPLSTGGNTLPFLKLQ